MYMLHVLYVPPRAPDSFVSTGNVHVLLSDNTCHTFRYFFLHLRTVKRQQCREA